MLFGVCWLASVGCCVVASAASASFSPLGFPPVAAPASVAVALVVVSATGLLAPDAPPGPRPVVALGVVLVRVVVFAVVRPVSG